MAKGTAVLLGVVLVFFIVVFATHYGILALGSTDNGVNMSASPTYANEYKAAQNTSIASIEFFQVNPLFLAIGSIIIILLYMFMKRW